MWKNHRLNKRLSPSLLGRISGRRCFLGRFRGLLFLLLLVLETRHCDGLCSSKKSQSTRPCCPIRTDELRSCSNNANRNRHWRTASRAATADLAAGQLFPLPAECRGVGSQTPALALSRSVRSTASGRVWRVLTENSTGHSC